MIKIDVTTNDGYLLASVIRGPDIEGSNCEYLVCADIKMLFTARIRHWCGVERSGADIRKTAGLWTTFNLEALVEYVMSTEYNQGLNHYLSHVYQALQIITKYGEYHREAILLLEVAGKMCDAMHNAYNAEQSLRWSIDMLVQFASAKETTC